MTFVVTILMGSLARKIKPYQAQMKRIERWRKKIKDTIDDYENWKQPEYLFLADMIFAFFTCCDHMKDYIDNDDMIDMEVSAHDYLKKIQCLRNCRAISVGTKHLKITNPDITEGIFLINLVSNKDEDTGELNIEVNLKSKKVKENFTDLANNCIKAWDEFIQKEILSKTKKQIEVVCPNCKHNFNIDYDFMLMDCPKCGLENFIVRP